MLHSSHSVVFSKSSGLSWVIRSMGSGQRSMSQCHSMLCQGGSKFGLHHILLFQSQIRIWQNLSFQNDKTIRLMKLMVSTMLSAAITAIRGSTVQFLLCYSTVCQFFTNFVKGQWILYFFVYVTLTNIANTPLGRSAVLVLSVIHWTYNADTLASAKSGKSR